VTRFNALAAPPGICLHATHGGEDALAPPPAGPAPAFDSVAATSAALVVALAVFLLARNQPIAGARLFFAPSLAAATLGATTQRVGDALAKDRMVVDHRDADALMHDQLHLGQIEANSQARPAPPLRLKIERAANRFNAAS
jgi:hypothetical protein